MTTAQNRTEPPVNRRLGFEAAPYEFHATQQDYYGRWCGTLLHSYCTGSYTEVTVLLLWSNSAVIIEYPHSYSVGEPAWVLQGSIGATSK